MLWPEKLYSRLPLVQSPWGPQQKNRRHNSALPLVCNNLPFLVLFRSLKLSPRKLFARSCAQQKGWGPQKRDAYTGTSLKWPAASSAVLCLGCDGANIAGQGDVLTLKNFKFYRDVMFTFTLFIRNNFQLIDIVGFSFKLPSNSFYWIECKIGGSRTLLPITQKFQLGDDQESTAFEWLLQALKWG